MSKLFTFLFALLLLSACGSNDAANNVVVDKTTPSSQPSNSAAQGEVLYPSITLEEMQNLWNSTTSIDYLFYELPISMNMTETPAIQSTLRQISDQPAKINKACKAMGRVFFQDNGNSLAEADFYFTPKCTYFIFIEDQKPVKSNQMTAEGIQFFKNILANSAQQK